MALSGRRVVVTGGAGYIGSHVVDKLLADGNEVVVVDDFSIGKPENLAQHRANPNLTVQRADVCDLEAMRRLTRGADVVFHMAVSCVRAGINHPLHCGAVNATGTLCTLQASTENCVGRFVYLSSAEVYGPALYTPMDEDHPLNPTNTYGASKAAGEHYALAYFRSYGLPTVVVRLFNTYGPREPSEGVRAEVIPRFVMRALAGLSPVIFSTGEQTRDFTYVEDSVRGILAAADADGAVGERFHLGRGEGVSVNTICRLVLEKTGCTYIRPIHLDSGRPGDLTGHQADTSRARKYLNWEPRVDISTGLDNYIAWVRDQSLDLMSWAHQDKVANW